MPRRRLLIGVVIAAAILVAGRTLSTIHADYSWYSAMGATPLWSERAGDLLLIYGIGSVIAVFVAFVNLSALGRSIGTLTLPRRLANVEFGEAVPRKYLDRFAFLMSVAIAAALTPALPSWTSVALARLGVKFRESDPYFQRDLGFYTTWLPFEKSVYSWSMLLIVGVSLIVVVLYSLTPGLRWERAGIRMSARVRRHLSVLAALLLLVTMWSYRLESYDLMIRGGGEQGVFSYVDHQWLLPGLLLLWIVTAAVAITVLLSGWTGQLRTSFVAVTVIVVLSVSIRRSCPSSFVASHRRKRKWCESGRTSPLVRTSLAAPTIRAHPPLTPHPEPQSLRRWTASSPAFPASSCCGRIRSCILGLADS